MLGAIADAVTSDAIFSETVHQASADAVELRGVEAQKSALQGQIDGTLDDVAAQSAAADLTPGLPLAVSFEAPEPLGLSAGEVTLKVTVAGANRTFVDSILDVPRRLRFKLNGQEYVFGAQHWQESAGGLRLEARIALSAATPPATGTVQPMHFAAGVLQRGTPISTRMGAGETLLFAEEAPAPATGNAASASAAAPSAAHGERGEGEVLDAVPMSAVMASSRIPAARVEARALDGDSLVEEPAPVNGRGSVHISFQDGSLSTVASTRRGSFELIAPEPVAEVAPTDGQGRPLLPVTLVSTRSRSESPTARAARRAGRWSSSSSSRCPRRTVARSASSTSSSIPPARIGRGSTW